MNVVRISETEDVEWEAEIGNAELVQYSKGIALTREGGVVAFGHTKLEDQQDKDYLIAKLDQQGRKQWVKVLGTETNEVARMIVQVESGGYIACGRMGAPNTFSDGSTGTIANIFRIGEGGDLEWSVIIGRSAHSTNCITLTKPEGEDCVYFIGREQEMGWIMG